MSPAHSKYSADIARLKMVQWCNKAERCHRDVREKLMSWGLFAHDRETIISYLIEHNLVNEKRYAEAFVHDKFKFNRWGAKKIEQQLKMKGISERNIHDALKSLERDDNELVIQELVKKREPLLKGLQPYQKKFKLTQYLVSRGFLHEDILRVLDSDS